jgi:hypothetical protein
MSWPEYQQVLANKQANIQLVGVKNGNDCVQPSAETIASGKYLLSRPAKLIVSETALAKPEVQSFLWYIASDANYKSLDEAGFVGVSFGSLPGLRDTLQNAYTAAATAALKAAEATPEATKEATPEATAAK